MADDFNLYVQQFEQAEQAGQPGRVDAEKARDYVDGNQFTATEIAILRGRKQPVTPENLIRPKIEGLCGLERQSRTDPKAWPRTQQHDQDADAATDALRYVKTDQDIDIKRSRVFENMLVEGEGAVEVTVKKLKEGIVDPQVIQIAHWRLYADQHSSEADRSDASFLGYITWMDIETAKRKWKDKAEVIEATMSRGVSSAYESFDDRPKWAYWYDSKRKRIRVNTHYHLKDGAWHRCVFTLAGELEESAPSVFIDEEDKPECPLIMQGAYVDRDNDRYGIVRDMIPLQDEVNKRRSKFLHMVNSNKIRVSPNVSQDANKMRKEYAKPDAVIIGEAGEVEELGNSAKEQGQFQLLADTRATLKGNVGPNATMQGKSGDTQSGRAILALQQAGMTEMTPLLDNLRHFTLRVYRQVWNRIRQYWTEERWIRVTDDERNVRFVALNAPPKMAPHEAMAGMQQLSQAYQSGQVDQQTAQQYAQQIQQMSKVQNPVAELDVDIDIDEVNETPTLQIEQFEQITQLMGTGIFGQPPHPKMVELWIKSSNLRDKEKLLSIVEEMAKGQTEGGQAQQELQQRAAIAEISEKEAKAAKTGAEAEGQMIDNQLAIPRAMLDAHQAGSNAEQPPA